MYCICDSNNLYNTLITSGVTLICYIISSIVLIINTKKSIKQIETNERIKEIKELKYNITKLLSILEDYKFKPQKEFPIQDYMREYHMIYLSMNLNIKCEAELIECLNNTPKNKQYNISSVNNWINDIKEKSQKVITNRETYI